MAERFPQFEPFIVDGIAGWRGWMRSNGGYDYDVAIYYPNDFPFSPPEAYILNLEIQHITEIHHYDNGKLCLFFPGDQSTNTKTTAALIAAWTAAWIFNYEHYCTHNEWLGVEAPH